MMNLADARCGDIPAEHKGLRRSPKLVSALSTATRLPYAPIQPRAHLTVAPTLLSSSLPWALVGSAAGSALVRLLRLAGRGVLGPGSEAAGCEASWLLRGACGSLRGATIGHHIMPRTGWSRCWLQAGRTRRCST
ncbi:hypothetical protein HaLaN_03580 [Haematococcus lacustris]|uniref:Uncharacterized protein n=1 Tax=Haematococcus lacustris TaxID=44745 RepID=A0A699YHB0_HAELA|nr:hypothetical protein HaLaN_03580 [Haematococcus lacustris]